MNFKDVLVTVGFTCSNRKYVGCSSALQDFYFRKYRFTEASTYEKADKITYKLVYLSYITKEEDES